MNFLAHLHLSEDRPEARMGHLLGDFVKGLPFDSRHAASIWRGIVEHRAVDAFADRHSDWKASCALLSPVRRLVAGIAVDVLYDHLLASEWERFESRLSFEGFIHRIHLDLRAAWIHVPSEARPVLDRLIEERWLAGYREIGGLRLTLRRMAGRSPALTNLEQSVDRFVEKRAEFRNHFVSFYPDVRRFVAGHRKRTRRSVRISERCYQPRISRLP